MYQGDLTRCGDAARQLSDVGRRLDDLHATVLGHVDQALALVYADDHDAALPILDGLTHERLAPSDRAWILYAEGEALAEVDPVRSLEAFDKAIDLADDVGNRFLGGVARVAATSVHARSGEPQRALQAFAGIIDDWRRQGNVTHLVISLRNLAELFARVGALEAAGELLGALQPRSIAAAYGAEAQRLAEATATLERTAGEHNVARWVARGGASRPSRGDEHRPRHDRHVDPHRAHPAGTGSLPEEHARVRARARCAFRPAYGCRVCGGSSRPRVRCGCGGRSWRRRARGGSSRCLGPSGAVRRSPGW